MICIRYFIVVFFELICIVLQSLMTLLRSFDDDIAILALEAIKALAINPFSHRTLNFNHHVTSLHKTSSHCAPLFQIVEAANWSFPLVAKEFLAPDFAMTDKHLLLEFDISQKPKVGIRKFFLQLISPNHRLNFVIMSAAT